MLSRKANYTSLTEKHLKDFCHRHKQTTILRRTYTSITTITPDDRLTSVEEAVFLFNIYWQICHSGVNKCERKNIRQINFVTSTAASWTKSRAQGWLTS